MNARRLAATLGSVTAVTLALLSMTAVGFVMLLTVLASPVRGIEHFPGDPPVPELCLLLTVPAAATALSCWLVARWFARRAETSSSRTLAAVATKYATLAAAMLVALDIASIGRRSFGEWAPLKRLLQEKSAAVNAMAGGTGRRLSIEEYQHAQELLFDSPTASFTFPSSGTTVRLRMMQTVPPYVGIDFGSGANAVFEPTTMVVTYSD